MAIDKDTTRIPDKDFRQLMSHVLEGLAKPTNKAAVLLAKISAKTLLCYSISYCDEWGERQRLITIANS